MARRIEIPFAEDGDFEEVPMDAQPDDTVSYAEGYTFDYQRPAGSSPLAKEIGRQGFNGILNDLSGVAKQFQDDGSPEWYAGVEYSRGARVKHADEYWACAIETGTTTEEPGTGEDWAQITIPARAIKNNLTATTAPTVDDDETLGYEPLSTWINTSTTEAYTCISAAEGAAHWELGTLTADQLGSMALQNSDSVSITGGSIDGVVLGGSSPSAATVTSLSSSGDCTLTGNGRKILAQMSSATPSDNLIIQTSAANNFTALSLIPSGSGNFSTLTVANASDIGNASYFGLQSTSTAARLNSSKNGSGTTMPIIFALDSTERGCVATNGNWGFGVAAASVDTSCKVQSSNGFKPGNSANSNVNVLDWYEEGTFTPVAVGTSTPGSGTYTSQIGIYTRVGNVVHITIKIVWTAHTGTGNILISGLPFTSSSANRSACGISTSNLTAANKMPSAIIGNSDTNVTLYVTDITTGTRAQMPMDAAINDLILTCHYFL